MTDLETAMRQAILDALPDCTRPDGDVDLERLLTEVWRQLPDDDADAAGLALGNVLRRREPRIVPVRNSMIKEALVRGSWWRHVSLQ